MQILERMARLLSPLLGGVVASLFGPYVAVVIAGLLLVASSIPLFLTVEPTKLRGKLEMGGFPWRASLPSLAGQFVFGYEWIVGGMVWTLFVSIFIFDALGQNVYAVLGGLSSIGILASIVVAWGIGKAVDRHKGGILLAMGAVASSVIHLFRPFVITPAGAAATNIASESSVSAYGMPLMRVMFDVADSSGHRIAYCMFVELSITLGIAAACGLGALLVGLMGEMHGLQSSFLIAAVVELILLVLVRRVR